MADIYIRVNFLISPKAARWGLAGALMLLLTPDLSSDSLTMTTWLPAPVAAYRKLHVSQIAYLARDAGGNVGIGTTNPMYKLDVKGYSGTNMYTEDYTLPSTQLTAGGPDSLMFGTGGSMTMRIFDSLNTSANGVGIATWLPAGPANGVLLDVAGFAPFFSPGTMVATQICNHVPVGGACPAGNYKTMQAGFLGSAEAPNSGDGPDSEFICCPCGQPSCPAYP